MRWTDRQIDQLDREGQISALRSAKNSIARLAQYSQAVEKADNDMEGLQRAVEHIKTGMPVPKKILIAAAAIFLASFVIGLRNAFYLTIVVFIGYSIWDQVKLSPVRREKADSFYQENYPPLLMAQKTAKEQYQAFIDSDEMYNVHLLLPDDYLTPEKIQVLIDILGRRRCRSISEAMSVYEAMEHQRKIEEIEKEKLRAARESAEAQKRTAAAAEETQKSTRNIAAEQKRQTDTLKEMRIQQAAGRQNEKHKKKAVKTCPRCSMKIPGKAAICPYCHSDCDDWITNIFTYRKE